MSEAVFPLPEKVLNRYCTDSAGSLVDPESNEVGFVGVPEWVYLCPKCRRAPLLYEAVAGDVRALLCPACRCGVKSRCGGLAAFVFEHRPFERWNSLVERFCAKEIE